MTHKNSYENEELHHLYEIIDRGKDDDVFKYNAQEVIQTINHKKSRIEKMRVPFFLLPLLLSVGLMSCHTQPAAISALPTLAPQPVLCGAARMEVLLPLLKGKRIGCVVNHTAVVGSTHLVDTLLQQGVNIRRIFAPEHGFRGAAEAGEHIKDGVDTRTNLPIVSIYGKKRKPDATDLADIDAVIFDIQDVGARFYTYISTLFYLIEACQEFDKELIVLDRPNPTGHYTDGPVLQSAYTSFVGIAPIALVHGCTVGELARMFDGEQWTKKQAQKLRLTVVPCQNYTHQTRYDLPLPPSPNLPDMRSVLLYPSICLFEGTTASLGRGTPTPFQIIGHPDFPDKTFSFVPKSVPASKEPPQLGNVCYGYDYRSRSLDSLRVVNHLDLKPLLNFYQKMPNKQSFFLSNLFFDKLAGNNTLRQQILEGKSESEIRASWEPALSAYKSIRKKYLLYAE